MVESKDREIADLRELDELNRQMEQDRLEAEAEAERGRQAEGSKSEESEPIDHIHEVLPELRDQIQSLTGELEKKDEENRQLQVEKLNLEELVGELQE